MPREHSLEEIHGLQMAKGAPGQLRVRTGTLQERDLIIGQQAWPWLVTTSLPSLREPVTKESHMQSTSGVNSYLFFNQLEELNGQISLRNIFINKQEMGWKSLLGFSGLKKGNNHTTL